MVHGHSIQLVYEDGEHEAFLERRTSTWTRH